MDLLWALISQGGTYAASLVLWKFYLCFDGLQMSERLGTESMREWCAESGTKVGVKRERELKYKLVKK